MGAGTGYNIPISISDATAFANPINFISPTYMVFSSPNTRIGGATQDNPNTATATATSSAAEGNAASSTPGGNVGVNQLPTLPGGISKYLTPLNLAIVSVAISIFLYYKLKRP